MKWYLTRGTTTEGPFGAQQIQQWLRSGELADDTLACPEDGEQWLPLSEVNLLEDILITERIPGASERRGRFGVLTAAIVLGATSLALDLVNFGAGVGETITPAAALWFGCGIAATITWAIFHYQLWALLPVEFACTTPARAVGFMFIPLFNCYWVFTSYVQLNRGLNLLAEHHGLRGTRASVGLAISAGVFLCVAMAIALLFALVPPLSYDEAYVQDVLMFVFASAPGFTVWVLMVVNQRRVVEHLLRHGADLNAASSLIET